MFFAAAGRAAAVAGGRDRRRRHPLGRQRQRAELRLDRDIDEQMRRTRRRPLPRHIGDPAGGARLRAVLGVVSTLLLGSAVNWLSAGLALAANVFYVFGYTMLLKRRTTQNIVWGGAAGCFPTLIGWTAVTERLAWAPVMLFLVVFFWTPPHFWALAMRYREDYAARRRADAARGRRRRAAWPGRSSRTRG